MPRVNKPDPPQEFPMPNFNNKENEHTPIESVPSVFKL